MAAPSTTLSRREPYATQSAVPQPSHIYGGAYSFGAWRSHPIPPPSLHGGEGSSLPGFVHLMIWSTLNLQWALNLVILVW